MKQWKEPKVEKLNVKATEKKHDNNGKGKKLGVFKQSDGVSFRFERYR